MTPWLKYGMVRHTTIVACGFACHDYPFVSAFPLAAVRRNRRTAAFCSPSADGPRLYPYPAVRGHGSAHRASRAPIDKTHERRHIH